MDKNLPPQAPLFPSRLKSITLESSMSLVSFNQVVSKTLVAALALYKRMDRWQR